MNPLTIQAPAKINLSLRVLGKRPDGFHEIDSLMVKLPGLCDEVTITPADEFAFSCDDAALPTDESNLVIKAARAFGAATGLPLACGISLAKRIPHSAGLGGGSSDAAATLVGLDRFFETDLGDAALSKLAASIGSDVPFFLLPGAARITGRGETVEPSDVPSGLPVVLLKPSFGVDTAWAYSRWQGAVPLPGIRYDAQSLGGLTISNDLELPVFAKFVFLAELKNWLLERAEITAALMCGSGSTLFGILRDPAGAADVIAAARHELDPVMWSWSGTTGK